jgi:hypothetical protein
LDERHPYDENQGDGRVLGPNNEMMTNKVFHGDFNYGVKRVQWKPQISTLNVAEWGWSARKPYVPDDPYTSDEREDVWETPKLRNFWYRPYYAFEAEGVRHEKKAICEVGD